MIKRSKITAILLAVMMVFTMMPMTAGTVYAASGDQVMNLGTAVLNQNVNTSNPESVWYADTTWRVIGYDGNGAASESGAITLLAADNLEQSKFDGSDPYNNVYSGSTFEGNVNGILDRFASGELGAIKGKTLVHGEYDVSNTDCIAGVEDLTDVLLWPLSTKEANAVDVDLRIVDPEHTGWATSCWWLRSPGDYDMRSAIVYGTGIVGEIGAHVNFAYGVRPAFNLNLESVLFTSAAEGGKSSGNTGADALKAQTDLTNNGNEWKVTVKDNAHAGFIISKITPTRNSVSVNYTGAVTGTNEYISAIITDADSNIKYYGRIAAASNATDASVTINTANKYGENDHLYVFNEQYNGDKKTDYASELTEVPIPKTISYSVLAKITAKGKSSLVLSWNKINGAEGYDIFFNRSGKKAPKKVKTIKGNKAFKWNKKSLKKKTAYKARVKAWVMKDGKKTYVGTSPIVNAYTSGGTKTYTNPKSVTVKKTSVSLKKGKTYKIKATVRKLKKGKKLMPTKYVPKLRYISSNKKIATVSKNGKITAKDNGSCKVYVIAANGAYKAIKVTVR